MRSIGGQSTRLEMVEREEKYERPCDAFLDQFAGIVDGKSVKAIQSEQEHMLGTLEVANEKLASLNSISEQNFQIMSADFKDNTRTLMNMKKQLDSVFRRIRLLKMRLASQYPEAYFAAESECSSALEEEEEEEMGGEDNRELAEVGT